MATPAASTLDPPALAIVGLTKRFGDQLAVDDLTFSVRRGRITGFLGPNGAGKTTTLRMVLGLAEPSAGHALVFGRRSADLADPPATVGALLDGAGFHPGRRAADELAIRAAAAGIADERVPAVLEQVGLEAAGRKRAGHLSLGMRQRLGLAAALLGEPRILVLDEPANGLDPAGMRWLRDLLRRLADGGTTVLVSSHVLAELALLADDAVVIQAGRLVTQSPIAELTRGRTLEEAFLDMTDDGGPIR